MGAFLRGLGTPRRCPREAKRGHAASPPPLGQTAGLMLCWGPHKQSRGVQGAKLWLPTGLSGVRSAGGSELTSQPLGMLGVALCGSTP